MSIQALKTHSKRMRSKALEIERTARSISETPPTPPEGYTYTEESAGRYQKEARGYKNQLLDYSKELKSNAANIESGISKFEERLSEYDRKSKISTERQKALKRAAIHKQAEIEEARKRGYSALATTAEKERERAYERQLSERKTKVQNIVNRFTKLKFREPLTSENLDEWVKEGKIRQREFVNAVRIFSEGAIQSLPVIAVTTLGSAVGFTVAGPAGAIFVPAVMLGLSLPNVTTREQKQVLEARLRENPELLFETTLRTAGALTTGVLFAKGVSKASKTIQDYKLNRFYEKYPVEDFFVKEELMMQYPQEVHYSQIIEDTVGIPRNTKIASDSILNPAELINKAYKKGSFYKLGDEYGLVLTGHDAIPVHMPFEGKPSVVYELKDIKIFQDVVAHTPGIKFQLNRLASQGIYVPGWLGVAGGRVEQTLKEKLENPKAIDIIVDKNKNLVFFKDLGKGEQIYKLDKLPTQEELINLTNFSIETLQQPEFGVPRIETVETEVEGVSIQVPELDTEPTTITIPELKLPSVETPALDIPLVPDREKEQRRGIGERTPKPVPRGIRRPSIKPSEFDVEVKIPKYETPQTFEVRFQYYASGERVRVRAKSWREAVVLASKRRKIKGRILEIEVEKT